MPKARESKEPSWASENDMQSIASWQPQKEYTYHIDVTNQKYLHIMSLFLQIILHLEIYFLIMQSYREYKQNTLIFSIINTNMKNFKFDFIDNIQEQVYNLSNGNIGNATGTISVQLMTENTFKISVNIENFGTGRNFSAAYEDEFAEYSLEVPNAYGLQNQETKDINSAVVTHTDGIYTIYLSSKEDITTVAGMTDADIVVKMPDVFMTNEIKGFSGTEDNAKISITYNGVKYNQANCSYTDDNAAALGGNARVNLTDDNIDIDFNVYSIYQYSNANLNGHYEGPVTKIQ